MGDKVSTWRTERARKKRERRWKQKKERVRQGHEYCVRLLHAQLYDEHLQRIMTARICDVRLAGIGGSRIDALERAGVRTAYDVYHRGEQGLCQVVSIGPKLANALLEWAHTHIPDSVSINSASPGYNRRLRLLKRQHFGLQSADRSGPAPQQHSSEQSYGYRSNFSQDANDDDDTESDFDYYVVLGVPPDASKEEIRAAYRQRMHEYHPDKVAHLGSELRSLAERKAKQLNEAYEALRGS
ncbi:MAG: J domain-containing protein [Chthoniobacterales bacterium]